MQLHGPTEVVREIKVTGYGSGGDKALRFPAGIALVLQSLADCDQLIRAAAEAKRQMSGAPQPGPVLPRIDPATLSHMRARLTAAALPEPDWCTAVTELDDDTFYCDRQPGHAGSHHAPGPDEGSEVAWSDEAGGRDISGLCHFHGGSRGDEAECAMCAAELARIALEDDGGEAREAAEFAADAASLDTDIARHIAELGARRGQQERDTAGLCHFHGGSLARADGCAACDTEQLHIAIGDGGAKS